MAPGVEIAYPWILLYLAIQIMAWGYYVNEIISGRVKATRREKIIGFMPLPILAFIIVLASFYELIKELR